MGDRGSQAPVHRSGQLPRGLGPGHWGLVRLCGAFPGGLEAGWCRDADTEAHGGPWGVGRIAHALISGPSTGLPAHWAWRLPSGSPCHEVSLPPISGGRGLSSPLMVLHGASNQQHEPPIRTAMPLDQLCAPRPGGRFANMCLNSPGECPPLRGGSRAQAGLTLSQDQGD